MSRRLLRLVVLGFVLLTFLKPLVAAEPSPSAKWEKTIQGFEATDAKSPPTPGSVLFIGSSSIALWRTLPQDFAEYPVIQRGFGGSQIADSVHFADRIVIPYKPSAIILHAGSNDISDGKTPEQVFADYRAFVDKVRAALPDTPIAFVSINPSPKRWAQADKQQRTNELIRNYVSTQKGLGFINIWDALLNADGQPRPELHIIDQLHPNAAGYKIRAELIHKYLALQNVPKSKPSDDAGSVPLVDLSGHKSRMNNYAERPCTVVLFLSNRCPITEQALPEVSALYRKYRVKDALYVGIVPAKEESDDELKTFVQRRGIIFPLYRDPDGSVTRRFGAKASLEAFVLNRQGKLVYHGGIDSEAGRAALDQVIAGLLSNSEVKVESIAAKGTPLDQKLAPIERDDPYGQISFSAEMIFEKIPRAAAFHCSTLTQASNGDLLCLWYGGAYETSNDQVLFLSRRKPGMREWSLPQVVVENPDQPPGNAILFVDHQKRLWLVWCRMESTRPIRRGSGWDRCRLMYRISSDDGATWSEDKKLVEDDLWAVPRNVPVTLRSGRLVLPLEASVNDVEGSIFLVTDDDGKSWKRSHFIPHGSQPTHAQRQDGTLVAFLRQAPKIHQLESKDEGLTWTTPQPTELNNPDSGIAMTPLQNGHWLMVFNDTPTQRTPLSITRSLDEGKTWEKPLHLESNPGEYSYPCILQTADGKIQLTYTFRRYAIKHVEMNEDWISHLTRPN